MVAVGRSAEEVGEVARDTGVSVANTGRAWAVWVAKAETSIPLVGAVPSLGTGN